MDRIDKAKARTFLDGEGSPEYLWGDWDKYPEKVKIFLNAEADHKRLTTRLGGQSLTDHLTQHPESYRDIMSVARERNAAYDVLVAAVGNIHAGRRWPAEPRQE